MNKIALSLRTYNRVQMESVLGTTNIRDANQKLRRKLNPNSRKDRNALFSHWSKSPKAEHFRGSFVIAH